jgi:hypothetical protein
MKIALTFLFVVNIFHNTLLLLVEACSLAFEVKFLGKCPLFTAVIIFTQLRALCLVLGELDSAGGVS